MRLLVLTELFLPTKGGTAVWAAEVYKRLGGKEVHIVTADAPNSQEIDVTHPNSIHRVLLKRVLWIKPESLPMYWGLLTRSLGLSVRHRFDVIHAFRALPEGLVGWFVARLTFLPVVTYAHGEELTTWGRGRKFKAMRFVLRHSDRVVANSEHTRDTLVDIGVNVRKIVVIYPGVDVSLFRPGIPAEDIRERLGVGACGKLIFSVGRLSRRKGFDQVIRAAAALVREGLTVRYAIAGIGEDDAYLDDLIQSLGMQGVVLRLGAVPAEELPRWMNACDVFAMPNREVNGDNEGFGIVFLEAAACGKPSVGGRSGGTGAAMIDGTTGLRVDGTDVGAIQAALRTILDDSELAARMGEAALQRVRKEFSWESVAQRTRTLLGC